jgi:hypothetical protein
VVSAELLRLAQRRPELSEAQRREIARTLHRVVRQLLHSPSVRVRELASEPGGEQYAALLRELFDLRVPDQHDRLGQAIRLGSGAGEHIGAAGVEEVGAA